MKSLISHHKISVGILGVVFCLVVLIPSGSVIGQSAVSHVQNPEVSAGEDPSLEGNPKAHTWRVPCEREDGTQGIFRISSKVTDEDSPLNFESKTETVEMAEMPPTPNIKEPTPVAPEEDPFGNPTLKCGRLLTLLAIFGTAESQTP